MIQTVHAKYCILHWIKFTNLQLRAKTMHLSRLTKSFRAIFALAERLPTSATLDCIYLHFEWRAHITWHHLQLEYVIASHVPVCNKRDGAWKSIRLFARNAYCDLSSCHVYLILRISNWLDAARLAWTDFLLNGISYSMRFLSQNGREAWNDIWFKFVLNLLNDDLLISGFTKLFLYC